MATATATVNNLEYMLDYPFSGYCSVSKSVGASGAIMIPASITVSSRSYFVYQINGNCFKNDTAITAVTIADGLREIKAEAFLNSVVTSINIPSSVTELGLSIWKGCTHLTSVAYNTKYPFVTPSLFEGCTALATITLPNTITLIDTAAFKGCTSLTSITLPFAIEYIQSNAFQNCTSLSAVNLPSNLLQIYEYAFAGCTALTSIVLPPSLSFIKSYAFSGSGLTSIELPQLFVSTSYVMADFLGTNVFDSCTSLTTMVWGSKALYIPANTFKNCTSLANLTIYARTEINATAFDGCTKLKTNSGSAPYQGTLNTNDTSGIVYNYFFPVGTNGFYLNSSTFEATGETDSFITYYADARTNTAYVNSALPGLTSYTVKSSVTVSSVVYAVTSIAPDAFSYSNATSVAVEEGITFIAPYVFNRCSTITTLSLPSTINSLLSATFGNCTALTNIEFIPSSVTFIGGGCFYGCTGLTSINLKSQVKHVGVGCFQGCTNATSVTLSPLLTFLNGSFQSCSALTSVTIPDSVYFLLASFQNCSSLTSVIINNSTTKLISIDRAFKTCTSLPSFVVPNEIVYFDPETFEGCTSLTSLTLSNKIGELANNAFAGLTSLTTLEIPPLVTELPDGLCRGCTSLDNVVIPETITSIGDGAFQGCTSLTNITFA